LLTNNVRLKMSNNKKKLQRKQKHLNYFKV
jgi:hypothetical protein